MSGAASDSSASSAASGSAKYDVQASDSAAKDVVLIRSEDMPAGTPTVRGPDFNERQTLDSLMASFATMGFQGTNVALAVDEVNRMLRWRLSDEPVRDSDDDEHKLPEVRAATRCTIFLGLTSNMISCGLREVVRYLAQHRLIDCIVTTAGGVEEDVMKTLRPHYMGSFDLKGTELRVRGINRLGNLLVPNLNYCAFEEWVMPLLSKMHDEQDESKGKVVWSPSKIIERFGLELKDESSVWYWCARNKIPVFCPGLTDGSVGDMLYFHLWNRAGFVLDIAQDIRRLNDIAMKAKKSGMLILGGGISKHHVCNANLMRNGADYSVFVNTASDFDGSDSGARPDEAVSWGKIKLTANPVKVYSDASIAVPLIVSQTFAKYVDSGQPARDKEQRAAADAAIKKLEESYLKF
jgi:deoxyhypusine synthase